MEQFDQPQQGNEETDISDQRGENVDTGSHNIQQRGQFERNRSPAQSANFPLRPGTSYPDDGWYKQSTPERWERNRSRSPESDKQRVQHRRHVGAQVKKVGNADLCDSDGEEQKQNPHNVINPSRRATKLCHHGVLKEQGYHRGNLNKVPTQRSHRDDDQPDEPRRVCGQVHKPGNRRPSEAPINSRKRQSMKRQHKRTREVESDQDYPVPDNRASPSSEHEQQSPPKKARVKTRNMQPSQQSDGNNSNTINTEYQTGDGNKSNGSYGPFSMSVSSKSSSSHSDSSSHRESSRPGRSTSKGSRDSDVIIKCSTGIRFVLINAANNKVVVGFENVTATYQLTEVYIKQ